jgi:hypothetical protein
MIYWNDYHDRVRQGISRIGRARPRIVCGYRTPGNAGKKTTLGADFEKAMTTLGCIRGKTR